MTSAERNIYSLTRLLKRKVEMTGRSVAAYSADFAVVQWLVLFKCVHINTHSVLRSRI